MTPTADPPARTEASPGHVFVVHGRLESLVHDAAVVPTDDGFGLEPTWGPLLDEASPDALRPPGWPGPGYGRAADRRPVWFVSVAEGLPTEELLARAVAAVREAACAGLSAPTGHAVRLVALPVLGIEGGGHEHDRGEVVRRLLTAMSEVVRELGVDVAVVAPEASVYGAAQHVRRTLPAADSPHATEAERLGDLARRGELALFFGAGVGVSAGLPGWREMLRLLAERAGDAPPGLDRLTPLDQAQLLQRRVPDLGHHVAELIGARVRPSLAHALLAGLDCREAITTNYDRLYETAVAARGNGAPRLLPWEPATGGQPWILKLHGDVERPESIVLTRRDFVRFDAETGPAGALLQSLLLTRHLLVAGASLNDDNVVRLVREAEAYREDHGIPGPMGTVLDVGGDPARGELWRDQFVWLTLPGDDHDSRTRALEILLDEIGSYAADASSWLLDPRFDGLLDDDAAEVAREARELAVRVAGLGPEWGPLRAALKAAGGAS
ncbi:SIR2 family protein [Nocardioides sp. DS6]|uniref:SIR2 family protein n=1 Tax=Nocardioides eburneus TaxID=3231482 RepID=A0ABV3T0J4_9ACTN